jgi:hypothetical protein
MLLPLLVALPAVADAPWVALHLLDHRADADLEAIESQLPALVALGVNVLVLEVDYAFEFRSHPELRIAEKVMTRAGARRFVAACRKQGVRVIPQTPSTRTRCTWGWTRSSSSGTTRPRPREGRTRPRSSRRP